MRIRMILISILMMLTLTHCVSYEYYRRVVQQGNLLPEEKIQRLKIGMNKEDTAILMGDSLLSPVFNNDRWDYAYTLFQGGRAKEIRHVSLYFSHGQLVRIEHVP